MRKINKKNNSSLHTIISKVIVDIK